MPRAKKGEITPLQVEARLMEIGRPVHGGHAHRVWNKATRAWEEDGSWTFDAANAIRALMEIGKYLGVEDRKEAEGMTLRVLFEGGSEEYAR